MAEFDPLPERYERLEEANLHSWYLNEPDRPFSVIMSVNSAGPARELDESGRITEPSKLARFLLAGNMTNVHISNNMVPGPSHLSEEERQADALKNMETHFINTLGVEPASVRVLRPERDYTTPLSIVDVDADTGVYAGEPVRVEEPGDFIYTRNPNIVLAVRPADCPIAVMSAETPQSRLYILSHFAWRGLASGQFEEMIDALDSLKVNRATLRAYITPGGQAETYHYEGYVPDGKDRPYLDVPGLFVDVEDHETGYSFNIDSPNYVYQKFIEAGFAPEQICVDTSDTTHLNSGYSSHARSSNIKDDNTRDIVTMIPSDYDASSWR